MAYNYSDKEIEETLEQMGINLPDRSQFNNLREDVNNRDNEFELTDENLPDFVRNLDEQAGQIRYLHYSWGRATIGHVDETIKRANDIMLRSVDHMTNLEEMVNNFFYADYDEKCVPENDMEPEIPISPTPYKGREDKENVRIEPPKQPRQPVRKQKLSLKCNEPPNPAAERRKVNQFLKDHCLMRASPKPGRPPFKTDRLKLLAKYREEWAKHPNPGEAKRLSLRWKIRQWMMRQEVPFIRLQKSEQITRPEWVD